MKYSLVIASVFLWIGFVCAISFLEAWLKFRAPGITVPLGLGIGRLVFFALNKIEWVFALVIFVNLLYTQNWTLQGSQLLLLLPLVILIIQTVWLLPALDARADLHIQGAEILPSYLHLYYVVGELIKVTALILFGTKLLKS